MVKNVIRSSFSTVETCGLLVYLGYKTEQKLMFYKEMHQTLDSHQESEHILSGLLEGLRFCISSALNPNKHTALWCLWLILLSFFGFIF